MLNCCTNSEFCQVTALGAAVAAGSALGVWQLGTKMENISVYRYCRWNILLNLFYVTYLFQTVVQRSVTKIILGILVIMIFVGQEDGEARWNVFGSISLNVLLLRVPLCPLYAGLLKRLINLLTVLAHCACCFLLLCRCLAD